MKAKSSVFLGGAIAVALGLGILGVVGGQPAKEVGAAVGDKIKTASTSDIVGSSGTTYQAYTTTDWTLTYGGGGGSAGTSSKRFSGCTLASYAKYADGTTIKKTDTAFAIASNVAFAKAGKLELKYTDGSSTDKGSMYLLSSTDNSTFSFVTLTAGTQGMSIPSTNTSYTMSWAASSASSYYAIVIKSSLTSAGNWRYSGLTADFLEGATDPSIVITGADSILAPNSVAYSADAAGTTWSLANANPAGCATISGATVTGVSAGTVDLVAKATGYADTTKKLTITETSVAIDPTSVSLATGGAEAMLEAKPNGFTPTSYAWSLSAVSPEGCVSIKESADEIVSLLSGSVAGTATLNVTASDGTISKSATATVTVNAPISQYVLSSNTTSYKAMTTADFQTYINNSSSFTITTVSNIRVGASPETSAIMMGNKATASSENQLVFSLPTNQIATSVVVNGYQTETNCDITVNGEGPLAVTDTAADYTFYPLSNQLSFAMTNRVWANSITINVAQSAAEAAISFGSDFLSWTGTECAASALTSATWTKCSALYNRADAGVQTAIKAASPNVSGTALEQAIARYDAALKAYPTYSNFLARSTAAGSVLGLKTDTLPIALIASLSLLGILATAGVFLLKKKHQ
jgi:hypothetical protein